MKIVSKLQTGLLLVIILSSIVTNGCKKKEEIPFSMQERQAFSTLKVNSKRRMDDLALTAEKVTRFFLPPGISEEKMRSYLLAGVEARDYILSCGLISPDGTMLYVEPKEFRQPEGLNLSKSEKYLYVKDNNKPYITSLIQGPNGILLQEYLVPVYNAGNQYVGVLTLLIDTAKLLDFISWLPDLNTINLLLFETDGTLIFNNRTGKLGGNNLNTLNADGAEQLVELIKKAQTEESGNAFYYLFDQLYDMEFRYYAQWLTIPLPGREWRIFMNTEYEIEE